MESMHESEEFGRFADYARTAEFRQIEAIAEALRAEFGISIDAHPGGPGNEAGVVNRAFRAAVEVILGGVISTGDNPTAVRTWALRRAALRRLDELGISGQQAEALLDLEPKLGGRLAGLPGAGAGLGRRGLDRERRGRVRSRCDR